MKEKIPFLLAAGIIPLATTAMAEDFSAHGYLSSDIGAAFQQKVRIHNGGDLIDFHNGVRGDVAIGYQATPWFAAEFASGVIWNSADKIGDAPVTSFGASLDLYQIPIMANVIVSTPAWHGLKPYVGAGVGGVAAMMEFQRPLGNVRDTDITFSYQAMAGLNYQVCKGVEMGIGYKFLQTDDHNWIEHGVALRTGGTGTHSVVASFIWSF
jgi:opacity protein-like surface antigen